MKRIIYMIIIYCFAINFMYAQTFTNYTTSNSGIASNNIRCIEIDKYNNKWIGSDSGLTKYDGINWTTWMLHTPYSFNNRVNDIIIDNQNNKWLATSYGLYKFDGINWTYYRPSNSALLDTVTNAVAIDSIGNIWVGARHGLYKFDGVNWAIIDSFLRITSIAVEPTGSHAVWAAADGVQKVFKCLNNSLTVYDASNTGFYDFKGSSVAIDKQNNVWLASINRGLFKFDQHVWYHIYDPANSGSNPSNYIGSIAIDEFNNKWCGSYNCPNLNPPVMMYNDTNWNIFTFNPIASNLPSIAIDSMGNKWIASAVGGLWKMNCQVPATPTAIQGSDTVTKGQMAIVFKIAHPNDALYYNWVLPNGFTGSSTSDSIIINIDTNAVSGVISVYGHNSCGNGLPLTFNVTVVASQVGINEETMLSANISVYPNPAANELNIVNSSKGILNYEIYNTMGATICKGSFTAKTTVQTAMLAKGIYLLKLYNEKGSSFQKIVKE